MDKEILSTMITSFEEKCAEPSQMMGLGGEGWGGVGLAAYRSYQQQRRTVSRRPPFQANRPRYQRRRHTSTPFVPNDDYHF